MHTGNEPGHGQAQGQDIEGRTRNIWCSRYVHCLNAAVAEWRDFDCGGCDLEHDEAGKARKLDFMGDAILLVAIFLPEVYQAYRAVKEQVLQEDPEAWSDAVRELDRVLRKAFEERQRKD